MDIDWFCVLICKKFIPIKKLGAGSYSNVWMAYDLDENKYNALKIYYANELKNGEFETLIFKKLNNTTHMLKLNGSYTHKEQNKTYYINSFELMMCSTQTLLDIGTFFTYGLPFNHTLKLVKQILTSLVYIHDNGYMHGDIKPENILVCGLSDSCRTIIHKLRLPEFVKKRKRSGVASQMIEYIKNSIENFNDIDSDESSGESCSEYEDSETDEVNNKDDDDKISLFDYSSDEDSLSTDKNINEDNTEILKQDYTFFLEKCTNVKLGDLGSAKKINDINFNKKHIQTSYYRAPEIILRTNYNEKIDIWAVGCMLYEFLTGEVLFDADEYDKIHFTRYHLFLINETVGLIPYDLIEKSFNRDVLFYNNTQYVKCNQTFDGTNNIVKKVKKNLGNKNLSIDELNNITDALIKMLECDFNKRISARELLNHQLFKDIV